MNLKLMSFEKPNARGVWFIPWKWQVVWDTKASSEYIVFNSASIHHTYLYFNTGKYHIFL